MRVRVREGRREQQGFVTMPAIRQLPIPWPAHLIPDATGTEAFHAAYRQAMAQHAVFVAIESERRQVWTVKADALAPARCTEG
ncbi:hypothetical protein ACFV2Z_38395 [Streptomyces sp. NPDC059688]|uniref:hypothetical protein n=1 Tax=Streptomyces sp. NPDC059688 TaxID=3346906 RepID=UPI00367971ED